jgi:dGTPase
LFCIFVEQANPAGFHYLYPMQFDHLFSDKRVGSDKPSSAMRSGFQRDFDRLIFSSGFRRLQNKTQVFPLPGTAFVHNRLTHSLEVASVGRSLGKTRRRIDSEPIPGRKSNCL